MDNKLIKNIYQKMSDITNEVSTVAKNLSVSTGKGSYKAVGEADILKAVKPIEEKNGIYSYPHEREILSEGTTANANGTVFHLLRLKTVYRFVNMELPTEYIDIVSFADGLDTGDKACGKAMTYADKYALMKAYKIQTGDDPDADGSPDDLNEPKPLREEPLATDKQIALIKSLYSIEEITKMLGNLGILDLSELTVKQASTMIEKRKGKN